MKRLGFIIAITLLSGASLADGVASTPSSLSIATIETGVTLDWEALEIESQDTALLPGVDTPEHTRKLNESFEARLERRLKEKQEGRLAFDR